VTAGPATATATRLRAPAAARATRSTTRCRVRFIVLASLPAPRRVHNPALHVHLSVDVHNLWL